MPSVLGFRVNPKSRATVAEVADGSAAAKAGLETGDAITSANGQPILSAADLQWVLHRMEDAGPFAIKINRGGKEQEIEIDIKVPEDWRGKTDISWRVSTWDLRRMGLGGMYLERVPDSDRAGQGLPPAGTMALRAKHVGQYGDHAIAKKAGIRKEDIIISFNGDTTDVTEGALLKNVLSTLRKGAKVKLIYLRKGARRETEIRLQ